ncbi:hypothetical protein [Lacisediminihabitans changchengi]|uniref:Uncharacterized protein n=1 Tax=Lacisediminihabitans changchengi TaxID=2787634 RepID=A0A934SQ80_9MICO|nr:hypothetical protein [Lacisediminihabitans changchengi]MBK4346970.1 hypothetical protein [Lacisediminihabitans changchengi]MBK4347907.1 hypothetical protein [Lacisediminihabitans changchengi]
MPATQPTTGRSMAPMPSLRSLLFDTPEPREILITAAPGCPESILIRHVTGALDRGNTVALLCLADLDESAQRALAEVERTTTPGALRQVHRGDWLREWSISVVVILVTGDHAFVSDGPGTSDDALGFVRYAHQDLGELYRRRRPVAITWECVPATRT